MDNSLEKWAEIADSLACLSTPWSPRDWVGEFTSWADFKDVKAIRAQIRERFVVPISPGLLEMLAEHAELERLAQRSIEEVLAETKQLLKILEASPELKMAPRRVQIPHEALEAARERAIDRVRRWK